MDCVLIERTISPHSVAWAHAGCLETQPHWRVLMETECVGPRVCEFCRRPLNQLPPESRGDLLAALPGGALFEEHDPRREERRLKGGHDAITGENLG